MKINSINFSQKVSNFIEKSPKTQKILRFADKNPALFNSVCVFALATCLRPSTMILTSGKDEDKKQDSNQEKSKEPEAIGITNNNQNSPTDVMENLKNILNLFAIILALAGISLIIIVLIKRRKNVKIYLEEDGQKVLIGKEKVTKDDRVLDLNKYYKKYNEDEYKVVLSKSISKKLDQKTVNIIIHDKDENFKVDYNNEEYSYRT